MRCDKVNILSLRHIVHESLERLEVLWIPEPRGVEVKTIRSPIGRKVTVKVVHKHSIRVLSIHIRRTTVYHSTGVTSTSLQLIHDQFPDSGITSRGTVLIVPCALVGHLKVQRVRPQGRIRVRGHHGSVIFKTKLLHHEELSVPTDPQKGHSDPSNFLHSHVTKAIDDIRLSDHLIEPVLDCGIVGPPGLWATVTGRVEMRGKELLLFS